MRVFVYLSVPFAQFNSSSNRRFFLDVVWFFRVYSLNLACKFYFFKIAARLSTVLSWNWKFIRFKFPTLISFVSAQFHERLWLLGFGFVRNQNSNSKQNEIHGLYQLRLWVWPFKFAAFFLSLAVSFYLN